jgi:hypothetical protein
LEKLKKKVELPRNRREKKRLGIRGIKSIKLYTKLYSSLSLK